jgi:flagellar hook-associated protein 3 FlgL
MTSLTSISTTAIQQMLTSNLVAQQSAAAQLDEQLSSGLQHSNLTDYSPTEALDLMNLQSSATQSQAYLGVISTVQTRLSGYDTTMTDMESIISQAQTLAEGNPTYNASTIGGIAASATNYLTSVGVDLNQQIGGRYIYAGSRYTTAPVADLTTLSASTLSPAVYTDGVTVPAYDTSAAAGTVTAAISGQGVTLGGTITAGQSVSVTVNGKTYSYTEQASDTTSTVATSLATLVAADIPGTTATGNVLTVGSSGTIQAASSNATDSAAYATDSATIGNNYSVPYGVSSDNPAFQQMIAGLRYLQAAGSTTDPTTYAADIKQAASLLTTSLTAVQAVHATVANNINTLTTETTAQNSAISSLTSQVDNIQQVDITQVTTELTQLETQLQASYSATGMIEKLSIVGYLPT